MKFLWRVTRTPCKNVSTRLIVACCNRIRPLGRPNTPIKKLMVNDVRNILPSVENDESFKLWAHITNDELLWFILINNKGPNDLQPCDYSPEWYDTILKYQHPYPESPLGNLFFSPQNESITLFTCTHTAQYCNWNYE